MVFEFLLQFVIEFIRALLIDELSRRVRSIRHHSSTIGNAVAQFHRRNRERLLNKLLTDLEGDL